MKKILISLLAIVLVAGCTIPGFDLGGTTTIGTSGKGLEITTFTAEPTPVYSGSNIRVTMQIENDGGSTVSQNHGLVYLTGSNMKSPLTTADSLYWYSTDSKNETQRLTRDMRPVDVVKGTSPDTATFTWSLKAPTVPAGQTRTDTFYGRTYCDYSTGVNGNVWVYAEGESDAAKASGRSLNKASFTSTSGPVALDVSVSPDPVILYSGGDKTFSLYIKIKNLASGTIYRKNILRAYTSGNNNVTIGADDYNQVYVNVTYDTNVLTNTTECSSYQELPSNKETTLVCDFNITDASSITFKSYPISVKADYGYYTEKIASVTVQGR